MIEKNAIEKSLATLIARKNTQPRPRSKALKREWRQPRWRPQPRKIKEVRMYHM